MTSATTVAYSDNGARIVSSQCAWIMAYGLGLVAESLYPCAQSAPISHTFCPDRSEIGIMRALVCTIRSRVSFLVSGGSYLFGGFRRAPKRYQASKMQFIQIPTVYSAGALRAPHPSTSLPPHLGGNLTPNMKCPRAHTRCRSVMATLALAQRTGSHIGMPVVRASTVLPDVI
jgi:hypothetical protein